MTKKQIWPALAFIAFQTSLSLNLLPANAADDATNTALVDLIKHSNIVNPNYKLTAAVSAGEALITTQATPKSSEAERKIEAVLIAKTAFESLPDDVQRVKLLLLDYDANDCNAIVVKRAEVKLFGSGGLSQKELLDSLEITKTTNNVASMGASVVDGPEQVSRMLVLGRIEKLKSQGANVSGYMTFFKQIEDAAKAGDEDGVKTKCAYLGDKLSDQESSIKQIRTHAGNAKTQAVVTPPTVSALPPSGANTIFGAPLTAMLTPTPAAVKSALHSRLSASELNSIDEVTIEVGMRQMAMQDKVTELYRRGLASSDDYKNCCQAHAYLYANKIHDATVLLIRLEQKFGRN